MLEIRHAEMDTTEATRRAYDEVYRGKGILLRDSFYLWLIALLKPLPGRFLLDVSCGKGRLVTFAQQQGMRAIGLDFALEGVRYGRAESPRSGWAVADGERLPLPDRCIDYVTHIGSLEHYQHPGAGMVEIARVLKPDGVACVLLPNSFGLFGNIQYVWRAGQIFDDGQPLQRYNTRQGWHNMLVAAGLTPMRTLKYEREWPRTWVDVAWYIRQPAKMARLLVTGLVPLNLANFLVYLCKRSDGG